MKRLYVAVGILLVLFAATLHNAHYLSGLTAELTDLLDRAEARSEAEDWDSARKLTERANRIWDDHSLYLHVFLRHNDTDDVEIAFREVGALLQSEKEGEYSAANARLTVEIGLLYEAEQLSMKNIL